MSAAAAWDPRWSLHAPTAIAYSSSSSYAIWKRRVQALLEAESVWEVVSESVVFDETWPLPKQLEFIQKDKLGMHLVLSTVHDSAVQLLLAPTADAGDECNRSWLMLKRLESAFAAHRMQTVRLARREFLALRFASFVARADARGGVASSELVGEDDAMQRFIDRVQEKGDALFRLRCQHGDSGAVSGSVGSSWAEDEKMYQLLDALPDSWAGFVAQECESLGDLTWASVQRKVLVEYAKRRGDALRKRLMHDSGSSSSNVIVLSGTAASATAAISGGGAIGTTSRHKGAAGSGGGSTGLVSLNLDGQGSNDAEYQRVGSGSGGTAFSSPVLTAKAEPGSEISSHNQQQQQYLQAQPQAQAQAQQHQDDHYDLRSESAEDDVMVFDFVGQAPPPPQSHQQPAPSSYQQQDPYYDHNSRPKYRSNNSNNSMNSNSNARSRRDRDRDISGSSGSGMNQQRTPYSRPSNPNRVCFYCSEPGHVVHQCPLKRMHIEERKKNMGSNNSHQ